MGADLRSLFQKARMIPGMSDSNFKDWEYTCESIQNQLSEDMIRVAVIGPIKSGKSTFVNSLFKGDYLKRGAGVITSIVTKIHDGKELKATLQFKSWDDVNAEIGHALSFFPPLNGFMEKQAFDIRKVADREKLAGALREIRPEQMLVNNARNANSVILSSYLKGYDLVSSIQMSEDMTLTYDRERFAEHRVFAGNEVQAVYLKDIQLEIDAYTRDRNVEIADCQGSDSANPLHIVMIQDYLLLAHLLVYVISSRTGLREADIKFLSMIKKMGVMDNILFVVNCDFSEHESLEGVQTLVEKIREDLSLLKPDPEVFTFSALYNLFKAQQDAPTFGSLPERDRARKAQWDGETELNAFSEAETARFESFLDRKVTGDRYPLLLTNHLERLKVIVSGFVSWNGIGRDILSGDRDKADELIKNINHHQKKMKQIREMVRSTLDGGTRKLQAELRKDVDGFFERRSGEVVNDAVEYIRGFSASLDVYGEKLDTVGFTQTLSMVYQEFKQALDTFMAETVNPKIIGFIKKEEVKILETIDAIAEPFDGLAEDALTEFTGAVGRLDETIPKIPGKKLVPPEIEQIKQVTGIRIPAAVAIMRYSARVKTEAVIRLWIYSALKGVKKILKKPIRNKKEDAFQALKDGIRRMKVEAERSILFHLKNYRENIKFQYMFKLADAVSDSCYELLLDRFQAYITDLSEITKFISEKRIDREHVYEILQELEGALTDLNDRIKLAGDQIRQLQRQ